MRALAVENAALRLQLDAFRRKRQRPVLTSFDGYSGSRFPCLEKERALFDWANALRNRGLCGSRGVGESHLKPHTCQLAHIVALRLSFVPSEEVVGPQILEMSVGLEHGVANHQNAVGNRQGRLLGTAPGGDALILGTKIAVFVFDGRPRSL